MSIDLQELNQEEVFKVFKDLITIRWCLSFDETGIRRKLEAKFGIKPSDIRPWHYVDPFFQEVPASDKTNLDPLFKRKDILQLSTDTFQAIGIEVPDLYGKSGLYPRENKNSKHFVQISIVKEMFEFSVT
ncbi:hypothetical protein ACFSO7_01430 [Bacillus sp. CGMCC 1.16607]|uniref:hypothetical protein n=1 Tax=Bacillus sp. CGMCC 1.16607 TaxID=3351842 RepID=UPI00363FCB39